MNAANSASAADIMSAADSTSTTQMTGAAHLAGATDSTTTPAAAQKQAQQLVSREELEAALIERHGAVNHTKLHAACVGVAGLGGLGSHIAVHLTRLGVGKLVICDFDVVELSNLNRQHYFVCHLGQPKTEALASQLYTINPYLVLETHTVRVSPANIVDLFGHCDVICEAFDKPDQKAMFVETVLDRLPHTPLVSGSGMAGFRSANLIETTHPLERFYLSGDRTSDVAQEGALASPRVGVCAAHEATMAARLILGETEP